METEDLTCSDQVSIDINSKKTIAKAQEDTYHFDDGCSPKDMIPSDTPMKDAELATALDRKRKILSNDTFNDEEWEITTSFQNRKGCHAFFDKLLPSILLFSIHPFTHPSFHPSIHPFTHPSIRPSNHPSIRPSIRPFIRPSISPSIQQNI